MAVLQRIMAAGLLGLGATTSTWCQDLSSGVIIPMSDLVRRCESCHGPEGVSRRQDVPSLANRSSEEIVQALGQFRFRKRHCPARIPDVVDGEPAAPLDMCNISASLSQTEKQELANHFSTAQRIQD